MPNTLSASDAIRKIRDGTLTSEEIISACLARIDQTDDQIKAWVHLDRDIALAQAREKDAIRQSGKPMGALHGIPVGIKDIVDCREYPTECGTSIYNGNKPAQDAAIIERLRDAGAVILGKTATAELAFVEPAKTRNPHNVEHSPGGSSSGSAAAVAAYQVPLAIGTQTNGSVIRPGSFCGTFAFKPTRGVISRRGILQTSKSLDQVGVFTRCAEDAALIADVIGGYDQNDSKSYDRPRPAMLAGYHSDVPSDPIFAWFEMPYNDRLSDDAREGIEELMEALGNCVERYPVPDTLSGLVQVHNKIHEYEICRHLEREFTNHWDQISAQLQAVIERARLISDSEYADALEVMSSADSFFADFFNDYDAIIAPSSTGEAVTFGKSTGDPVFCTIWTLAGLPCLNLPILVGSNEMPIGVQLIGAVEEDDRLFRTANWLLTELRGDAD